VGTCNNDVDRFACNDLADFGSGSRTSDRMRIVSMVPGPFDRGAEWNAPTLSTFKTADYPALADTPVMENNTLAFIDGECAATSESYVAMVEITSTSSGTTTGFHRDYAVTDPPPGSDYSTDYPTRSGCAGVLGPEVKVSLARVVDFYIDRTEDVPRLMMNVNPEGTFDAGSTPDDDVVVAYNIDSLQIEYGVDVGSDLATTPSDVPDQEADIWCADLTDTLCDTNSILASGLTPAQRAARVVAVRIAVVPRAETTSLDEGEINPDFTVMSSLIPGDRFRRWVFRGGVRLRNNEL
ncbi:MAG: PilW family protein, partial [Myxococcota bacterium]